MKKILISLAIIGVVAGITLGITGAWWTDEGTSTNQSFKSGTLNLQLSNTGTGGWKDTVNQTWNVNKMTPGGTPYVSTLYMRNKGSVNADYLKFTLKNTPDPAGMDKVMRITKLEYKGESLLTGGAGADLSSYEAPTNCTVVVSKINPAIAAAAPGDVICVKPGNYTFAWEGGVVNVTKGVTIASTDGPGSTTIGAGIRIMSNDVTIQGFKITPETILGEKTTIYFDGASNVEISYNDIDGQSISASRGILVVTGHTYSAAKIENNVIHDLGTGIYTNPHTGIIDIQYNDFYNCEAGIGGTTSAIIKYNVFRDNDEAVGTDSSTQNYTIRYNEFLNGDKVVKYGTWPNYDTAGTAIVAENNWWGDFDPSDQVLGNVDYTPYAGGPFIGYINGQDLWANGFADLEDFERSTIVVENPGLQTNGGNYRALRMGVQLDGPTTGNTFMDGNVGMDMTVTMGQGPAQ